MYFENDFNFVYRFETNKNENTTTLKIGYYDETDRECKHYLTIEEIVYPEYIPKHLLALDMKAYALMIVKWAYSNLKRQL